MTGPLAPFAAILACIFGPALIVRAFKTRNRWGRQ